MINLSDGIGYGRRKLIEQIITKNWNIEKPEAVKYNYNELLFVIQEMMQEEGKNYLQPNSTAYGFKIFRDFVKLLLYRNIANYDSMVLLTADKGAGKSSAAIMMAREWCKVIGIKFNPDRHIAYNNADVMEKIDKLEKFEPIICDEAIRFASSADWAKKENKELKKKLGQVRTKHLLYILCFPLKIQKLEKTYLESYTNYWCDLYGRGKGAIYVKDKNPVQDSWRLKEFSKLGSYTEFTIESKIKEKLKKHPNFWQLIKFPKPPKWLYTKYLNVREKNIYDDDNVLKNVSKEDIHRALLILALRDIMRDDVQLSANRVLLHIKNEYDINLTKNMIQNAIEDAKQLVIKTKEQMA